MEKRKGQYKASQNGAGQPHAARPAQSCLGIDSMRLWNSTCTREMEKHSSTTYSVMWCFDDGGEGCSASEFEITNGCSVDQISGDCERNSIWFTSFWYSLSCSVAGGTVILEETTSIRIEMFPSKMKVITSANMQWFAMTLPLKGTNGPGHNGKLRRNQASLKTDGLCISAVMSMINPVSQHNVKYPGKTWCIDWCQAWFLHSLHASDKKSNNWRTTVSPHFVK